MTREQAIAAAPLSPGGYWLDLALTTVCFSLSTIGVAYAHNLSKTGWMAIGIAYLAVCTFSILQTAERLFFPHRAALRASRLAQSRLFPGIVSGVHWLWRIAWAVAVVIFLVARPDQFIARAASSVVVLFAGLTAPLTDLYGERRPDDELNPEHLSISDLKPIQSEKWGEPNFRS